LGYSGNRPRAVGNLRSDEGASEIVCCEGCAVALQRVLGKRFRLITELKAERSKKKKGSSKRVERWGRSKVVVAL